MERRIEDGEIVPHRGRAERVDDDDGLPGARVALGVESGQVIGALDLRRVVAGDVEV